ncbi:hypothetical protein Lser_V15G32376 [Lactuca serriola]
MEETSSGVLTEDETKYHALKMLLSLIPFVAILTLNIRLSFSSEKNNGYLVLSLLLGIRYFFTNFHAQSRTC